MVVPRICPAARGSRAGESPSRKVATKVRSRPVGASPVRGRANATMTSSPAAPASPATRAPARSSSGIESGTGSTARANQAPSAMIARSAARSTNDVARTDGNGLPEPRAYIAGRASSPTRAGTTRLVSQPKNTESRTNHFGALGGASQSAAARSSFHRSTRTSREA